MTAHPGAFFRTAKVFATGAVALVLVTACSATASPHAASAAPSWSVAHSSQALTATPVATPAPTPAISVAPQLMTLAEAANHYVTCPDGDPDDCLIPGTYRLGSDVLAKAVSPVVVPAGWLEWDMGPGTEGLLVERTDVKDGSGWGALFSSVGLVFRDPCDLTKGTFPSGSTNSVDGLIDAMTKWPGFQVSQPRPTTLGGVQGKQVAVTSSKTNTVCPDGAIWSTPQGTAFNSYPEVADRPDAYTAQFQIFDVGGDLLAIRTTDFPDPTPTEVGQGVKPDSGRHVADQKTLHAILDSLRFGPGS
jgi:hypothetical protein